MEQEKIHFENIETIKFLRRTKQSAIAKEKRVFEEELKYKKEAELKLEHKRMIEKKEELERQMEKTLEVMSRIRESYKEMNL